MKINEIITETIRAELDEKASRKLCLSTKPNSELGASNLSSCVSQGLRAHNSKVKHTIGKKRSKINGKKIKGKRYGGPLPDWS